MTQNLDYADWMDFQDYYRHRNIRYPPAVM